MLACKRSLALIFVLSVVIVNGQDDGDDAPPAGEEIMAIFAIFFAVCLSLIAVCLAYFAVLEDGLMRIYTEYGLEYRASVLETQFLRGATKTLALSPLTIQEQRQQEQSNITDHGYSGDHPQNSANEYDILIEYQPPGVDPKEKCTITKHVKALESDLVEPPAIPRAICLHGVERNALETQAPLQSQFDAAFSIGGQQGLDILVLRDYPKSGFPQRQAERACTVRYRLPTMLLIVFLFVTSTLAVRIGLGNIPNFSDDHVVSKATIKLILLLVAIEAVGVHYLLGGMFRQGIKDLYLDGGGQFLDVGEDDTTISTKEGTFV